LTIRQQLKYRFGIGAQIVRIYNGGHAEDAMRYVQCVLLAAFVCSAVSTSTIAGSLKKFRIEPLKKPAFGNVLYAEDETTGETRLIGDLWESAGVRKPIRYEVFPDHNIIIMEDYAVYYTVKIISLSPLQTTAVLPISTEEPDITWITSPRKKKIYVSWVSMQEELLESASFDTSNGRVIAKFEPGITFDSNPRYTYFSPDGKLLYAVQYVSKEKKFFRVTIDVNKDKIIGKEHIWGDVK